jgi:DNA-binding NarL/FixJ family response regulator
VQVATLVWQGLANRDIAGVLGTSEQVVKNYLRTTFDKLGVWTRLELALYVAARRYELVRNTFAGSGLFARCSRTSCG